MIQIGEGYPALVKEVQIAYRESLGRDYREGEEAVILLTKEARVNEKSCLLVVFSRINPKDLSEKANSPPN